MKKLFKFFSILISLIILIGTIGVNTYWHYCKTEHKYFNSIYFPISCEEHHTNACCHNETHCNYEHNHKNDDFDCCTKKQQYNSINFLFFYKQIVNLISPFVGKIDYFYSFDFERKNKIAAFSPIIQPPPETVKIFVFVKSFKIPELL